MSKIVSIFGCLEIKDVCIGAKKIFSDMNTYQSDRLAAVLGGTANYEKNFIDGIISWAELRLCSSPREFFCLVEYFCAYVWDKISELEFQYRTALTEALSLPDFRRHEFDRNRGIVGSRRKFFKGRIIEGLRGTQLLELDEHFMNLCRLIHSYNEMLQPRCLTECEAAYHFLKHQEI